VILQIEWFDDIEFLSKKES